MENPVTNPVAELVRKMEDDDQIGVTTISKYVQVSLREDIEKIDAYSNSKFTSGDTDSLGRDKPFFNIVTAATNIWFRATDIDRKNIKIKATKQGDFILSFLASIHLTEWMRHSAFGQFLNEWGRTLAKYGSAVVKFVEKDGELYKEVVPWNRLLCDAVDFDANPKIEKLWLTPAQLKQRKGYNQEMVKELISNTSVRQTMDRQQKDSKADYILLYEVHGLMPLSYLTENEADKDTFQQQMHVISFKTSKKGEDDYTLFKGRESKDPYMITHLIKEDGYTLGTGAVKHLFQAQWMMNHTIKMIKDQLDLASKLIFQTSDGNFVGQNALNNIENGDILVYQLNQPLTQLQNNSHDITSLQNFATSWKSLGNEITGVSESMMGETAPAGTPWRQVEALLNESHSLFEMMVENKGLALEDMFTKYIIPFIKKKMDTTEEIAATLEEYQILQFDSLYAPNQAIRNNRKKIIDRVLSDEDTRDLTPEWQAQDIMMEQESIKKGLTQLGNQRFIKPSDISTKTWKEAMKDLEWKVEVDVTGEQTDRQNALVTYQTALQFIASLQGRPLTPDERFLFNKLISQTGHISPLELTTLGNQPNQPAVPVGASPPSGVGTAQNAKAPLQKIV
jgi:hypothetical protein